MPRCLLALGSNLGDRYSILDQACAEIEKLSGCQLLARSRWHGTVPIGGAAGQGDFLNGAVLLESTLPATKLATELQQIETRLGRQRVVRWDARSIDIDVLLYGTEVIDTESLIIPHPRMAFRNFVLEPAVEIAGDMLHPTSGWTLRRLLTHMQVSPRFVVVTAIEKTQADELVAQLSQNMSCPVASAADKKRALAGVSSSVEGVQFPQGQQQGQGGKEQGGKPPLLMTVTPEELAALTAAYMLNSNCLRPALVIALDLIESTASDLSQSAAWLRRPGQGPVARITADDPATVLQEAEAALRCIWPDLTVH